MLPTVLRVTNKWLHLPRSSAVNDDSRLLPELFCLLLGFLLFAIMFPSLVAGCVSLRQFHVITAILNMFQ